MTFQPRIRPALAPFEGVTPEIYREAIRRFGPSLYLYDGDFLRHHVSRLRATLPADVEIVYSVKANPNPHLIRRIAGLLQGVEVSSEGELAQVLAAGLDPSRILLIGPAKSEAELEFGVRRGARAIVAESACEVDDILRLAQTYGSRPRVLVRVNPDFKSKGARLTMTSASTQFGMEPGPAEALIRRILASPHLEWAGLHVYVGTRILDAEAVVENCRQILALADRLAEAVGQSPPEIDFGGGFGVPYFDGESSLDIEAMAAGMEGLLAEHRLARPGTRYLVETGRYLVAESGLFLTAIRRLKENKGSTWILTVGGTNHFAAHTFMGTLMRRNFPLEVVTRPGEPMAGSYNVCGPLCTPSDIVASNVKLPAVDTSDLLAVRSAGAYGYSNSPQGFLSHPTPAEAVLEGDELTLLRPSFGADALLRQTGFDLATLAPLFPKL